MTRKPKEVIAMNNVFNTLLELDEGRDPEFARAYAAESARIEAIDSIINALDEARGTDPGTVKELVNGDKLVHPAMMEE
jgi:hypothetical protein